MKKISRTHLARTALALSLLTLLCSCCDTEWNDRHYTGEHDDTLGLNNKPMFPAPPPLTASPAELAERYANAGPGGSDYYDAISAPTSSNGGAGLWGYDRPAANTAPAPQPARPQHRGRH